MKPHLLTESASTANPAVTARVSRKKLRERAVELAAQDGRVPQDAGKSDWEAAKDELIGEPAQEPEPKAPRDNDSPADGNPSEAGNLVPPGWMS